MQFLIESGTMALVAECSVSLAGSFWLSGNHESWLIPSTVALWSVLVGLLWRTSTGVFFGVYPARKAAMLIRSWR